METESSKEKYETRIEMNSKDFIIHRLKENIKESFPRPEVNISHVVYPDKLKQFIEISAGVGGRAEVLGEGESIDDAVRHLRAARAVNDPRGAGPQAGPVPLEDPVARRPGRRSPGPPLLAAQDGVPAQILLPPGPRPPRAAYSDRKSVV